MTRTDREVAWIAGLFEGEGSFSIAKNGGTRITIRMTDRDIIDRVDALFPCTRIQVVEGQRDNWKTQYAWRISDPVKVREFIELVLPWLGKRRTARAREVLAHLDTRLGTGGWNKAKTRCARGHEFTPGNIYTPPGTTHRCCRMCRDEWARAYRERKAAARG